MTDERREELHRAGLGPISGPACGCVYYGSERDEKDCRVGHVPGASLDQPSADAMQLADEFLDETENETCEEFGASCLRDDLADNRKWLRVKLAQMLDKVRDGRSLYARP